MALNLGYRARPRVGETECGDVGRWWLGASRMVLALADGLGHGPLAAQAAHAAMASIESNLELSCEQIFAHCDQALQNTRGVALAVAIIERATGRMTIGAVGNIRTLLITVTGRKRFSSARGIVGAGYADLLPVTVDLIPGEVLVLFSDGFDELIPLDPQCRSEQELANVTLRQWARHDDDASVLMYRHQILRQ